MLQLEYLTYWQAALLFMALAAPVVWLGARSLNGLGPVRKWVAVGARLLVLLLFVLILGGAKWTRSNSAVEVMVLRDVSQSTAQVRNLPERTLRQSINQYLQANVDPANKEKRADDKIGVVSFDSQAYVDAIPNTGLVLDTAAIRRGASGTNIADAIQLGLATFDQGTMHRILLITDGNATAGDVDAAIRSAAAQKVPIDVMPLDYSVDHEVLVDRFVAPTWKRENEPFTIEVILRSTNSVAVTGKLQVLLQGQPMEISPGAPDPRVREVTLKTGRNVERVQVPALSSGGVHQFKAIFTAAGVDATVGPGGEGQAETQGATDTLLQNNTADAFTFVRGKGKVLLVDNAPRGAGKFLREAMAAEGIDLDDQRFNVASFPPTLVELQNYDAVVLVNVPRGAGGLDDRQAENLASYVHDMGGGLVMVGGPDTFGAGGWQGSKLEEVLPVSMDIPAQRIIAKGALVLILHSCEMPQGNYWGVQCGIKAVEVLNRADDIGVISYNWGGGAAGGIGGSNWDFPLGPKGDGSKVIGAIKGAQLGDMPSFDDSINVAVNGGKGTPGLLASDARQKHIIIISDGDPGGPNPTLMQQLLDNKITVSTVQVYGHNPGVIEPTMKTLADQTGGRYYGPIESNPSQLPQIFIKEATIVRRSLIYENKEGIPVKGTLSASDLVKGIDGVPPVYGMVLTSAKPDPQIEMPLTAGKNDDPILANWQTGLGRAAAFTSDATNLWAADWVGSPLYRKFWSQVVRGVERPPESTDFDIRVTTEGGKGHVVVEALDQNNAFKSFLNVRGSVVGPDGRPQNVTLRQTAPGVYESEFDADQAGNYVVGLAATGQKGYSAVLRSGTAVNAAPELRELRSDDALLKRVADSTGGRYLKPWDPLDKGGLFTRAGLAPSRSPLPIWDILLPILVGLILLDVAIRRIAWDWSMAQRAGALASERLRDLTGGRRQVDTEGKTLDALRRVRTEVGETRLNPQGQPLAASQRKAEASRKFDAPETVEGDIAGVVGGATDKPLPAAPKSKQPPKGDQPDAGGMGSLMEAKRRAREQMRKKQEE